MRMRTELVAAVAAVGLLLSAGGCGTLSDERGAPRGSAARYAELKPRVTTIADAVAVMGDPVAVKRLRNGTAIFTWTERTGAAEALTVRLVFRPDGRLARVESAKRTP